jgi:hypothetical protein
VVADEPFAQLLADGQLPVFAAFRVTDLQHARVDLDVRDAQQPGFRAAQPARVDRAEQDGHHQMPERYLRAVAAAVGLREQRCEFLVAVDVRDVTGGLLEHPGRQHVCVNAAVVKPAGELSDRRDQADHGRRLHCPLSGADDPRLDRRSRDRAKTGELAGAERVEAGQRPLLADVLVAKRTLLGDQPRDRAGQRDLGAHWASPSRAGVSGSSAHRRNRPRDDFR